MKWFKENYLPSHAHFPEKKQTVIIDVGSYCINGGRTYRQYFNNEGAGSKLPAGFGQSPSF
jgi:hypothetical protein